MKRNRLIFYYPIVLLDKIKSTFYTGSLSKYSILCNFKYNQQTSMKEVYSRTIFDVISKKISPLNC